MFCSKCGKENDNNATVCTACGFQLAPISNIESENKNAQASVDEATVVTENTESSESLPKNNAAAIEYQPMPPVNLQPTVKAKKPVNALTIIIPVIVVVLAIIGVVTALVTINVIIPNKNLKNARELSEQGKYKEAIVLFEEYAADESDIELLNDSIQKQVNTMLDEGKYVEANEFLKTLANSKDEEKTIKTEYDRIKYESLALYCAQQDRDCLKSPSSFELSSVKFYKSHADDSNYNFVIMSASGKNGYGGISSHYSAYSVVDLDRIGSVSSNNIDNPSDIYEKLFVETLKLYTNDTPVYEKVNVARVTKILNEGIEYNIDIAQYKNSTVDSDSNEDDTLL